MITSSGGEIVPEFKVKCRECGKEYTANVNRNGYCDECKAKKTAEARHKYYNKRKANGGSLKYEPHLEICEDCGIKFETTGTQKRCPYCAQKYNTKQNNEYRNSHTDSLSLRLPIGVRDEMKDIASHNGLTLTSLILMNFDYYKLFLNLSLDDQKKVLSILAHGHSNDDEHNK